METFGQLIRGFRRRHGKSQLHLAGDAGVSTRHLSFIENGRSRPSREMVALLGDALDVSLRERNLLLLAAGLAPEYSENALDADAMQQARQALELILRGHEPFPAVCFDRGGDVLMVNQPYLDLARALAAAPQDALAYVILSKPRPNVVRLLLSSVEARQQIKNFDEVARAVIVRARRELVRRSDRILRAELEQLVRAAGLDHPDALAAAPRLIVPLEISAGSTVLSFFTTIATLGTTFDVTLDELRIEAYHPADLHTDSLIRGRAAT